MGWKMKRVRVVSYSGCRNCGIEGAPDGELVEYEEAMRAVAQEREACALMVEAATYNDTSDTITDAPRLAAEIRARGQS